MSLNLIIKLNNNEVADYNSSIRVTDGKPTVQWQFSNVNKVLVDEYTGVISDAEDYSQKSYEIRVSNNSANIGSDLFIANMSQTGVVQSQNQFWVYDGYPIERGGIYYGQIKVVDEINRSSSWYTFSFKYNSLPYLRYSYISPSLPSIDDNLILYFGFSDPDGDTYWRGTKIRWYKNSVYQKQFDNAGIIPSSNLQVGDIWSADIYPSDGYEYGERVSVQSVKVVQEEAILSNIHILPKNPNDHDVLTVAYDIDDITKGTDISVRWYVNNRVQRDFNDKKSIKPSVSVGDTVKVEIKHETSETYYSSEEVTIEYSEFIVSDIKVDGKIEPLDISTLTPLITWRNYVPTGKSVSYVSVKIGTFYEADNIYSDTFSFERESYTIPHSLLEKGRDYYISISISDSTSFNNYSSSHFRISGYRWELGANNSTGWTIETLFKTSSGIDYDDYHILRINDGSKFCEVRIYSNKIIFVSDERVEYSHINTSLTSLTVAGIGNDIKVYINRELVIDGTGIFTHASSIKRLELGCQNNSGFLVSYKYLVYTTGGCYYPDSSSEYANIQLHTFFEFEDNEIVALNTYKEGRKIFAVNPDDQSINSSIYSIIAGDSYKCGTTNRTFSPINRINKSIDEKIFVFAHEKGVTRIKNYYIAEYNNELLFIGEDGSITNIFPDQYEWELVQNMNFQAAYYDSNGLNINTTGQRE